MTKKMGSSGPPPSSGSGPVPTVTAVSAQASGVPINRIQEVQFSEAMDPATITAQNFTITDGSGKAVTGTVAYDPDYNVASFTPAAALQANASYTITVTTGVASTGEMHLQSAYTFGFSTGAASDTNPFSVAQVNPAGSANCVSATTPITITFSEAPEVSTLTAADVMVKGPDGTVLKSGLSISVDKAQLTVTPAAPLPSGAITVTLQNVADLAGKGFAAPYTWSFSTACPSSGGGGGGGGGGSGGGGGGGPAASPVEYLYSSAYTEGGKHLRIPD